MIALSLSTGQKDLTDLIQRMIKQRQASPPKKGEETFLDMIISYSTDEEVQHADALEFTTAGQYCTEYRKQSALFE